MLLCLIWLLPADAQADPGASRVQDELEKTDRILEKARELAGPVVSAAARGHYEMAIQLQRQAWQRFRQGADQHDTALTLTLRARAQALKALDAARLEQKAREAVRRNLEQAENRVAEVNDTVSQSQNARAAAVLEQGVDHLRRARRAHIDGHYVQAARLAILANTLIERAARLAQGEIVAIGSVETSIERTAMLLAQVEVALLEHGKTPSKIPEFVEAERLLEQARTKFRERRPRPALRLSLNARQKALRLMGELSQEPDREVLAEALSDLQALYAEVMADIRSSGSETAVWRIEEGNALLKKARAFLRDGKLAEAQRHLMAAERLLREAVDAAGS